MGIENLYKFTFGVSPAKTEALTPAGSNRRYFRLTDINGLSVVGVEGLDEAENRAFIYLARHFSSCGLPVPRILSVSEDNLCYLQEDLGDVSLFSRRHKTELLEKAVKELVRLQYEGAEGIDGNMFFPVKSFDRRCVLWDLNYFKYNFLNTTGVCYNESKLQDDFESMADDFGRPDAHTFMYRDFQSRNVMITDGDEVRFIDFQGGRFGPGVYDLVSFVRQARAAYAPEVRESLIEVYFNELQKYEATDRDSFIRDYRGYSLLRALQTLGAYGFRGKYERKPHFLKSIYPAICALRELIAEPYDKYPYLMKILNEMIEKEMGRLTVRVSSFSYKKGYPLDPSGNGGGFVFDCRAMENPGRYDEYKLLTGRDEEVIDFLERKGEVQEFLKSCRQLVDKAVTNYIERGFTSLSVAFGCTGGRHRSLYCADRMARHLAETFTGIRVILTHREQGIDEEL